MWREDPSVELDLATTYGEGDQPGRAVKISIQGSGRIPAYRMIPSWLHELNLTEPCHGTSLKRLGLERLRQTALLVSKLLAVDAALTAVALPSPPDWIRRIDRDLTDVLYLTDRQLQLGLWCAPSTLKRSEVRRHLLPIIDRLVASAAQPPDLLSAQAVAHLVQVADGLPMWWR